MEPKTKKILIIGAVVTSLILLAIILIVVISAANKPTCNLEDFEPWPETNNVASSNYKTLIDFAGYLIYSGDERLNQTDSWMALKLKSVETKTINGIHVMTMDLTCAQMEFQIFEKNKIVRVAAAKVNLQRANLGFYQCNIPEVKYINYHPDKHYACDKPLWFSCFAPKKTFDRQQLILSLVIKGIQFEIDGNPEDHKEGNYSFPSSNCTTAPLND